MKTYNVLIVFDVPYYANVEIQAENATAAKQLALQVAGDEPFEADWDGSSDYRIIDEPTEIAS